MGAKIALAMEKTLADNNSLEAKVVELEAEVKKLKEDVETGDMILAGKKKMMLTHEKGMEEIIAAITEYVPDIDWLDCPASEAVHGIKKLYDLWKGAEDYQRVVEERVRKQYEESFAGHKEERKEWKERSEGAVRERAALRRELEEKVRQAQRQP